MGKVTGVAVHPASGSSNQTSSESWIASDDPSWSFSVSHWTCRTSSGSKSRWQMISINFLKPAFVFWMPPFQYHSPRRKALLFGYGRKSDSENGIFSSRSEWSSWTCPASGSCVGKASALNMRNSPNRLQQDLSSFRAFRLGEGATGCPEKCARGGIASGGGSEACGCGGSSRKRAGRRISRRVLRCARVWESLPMASISTASFASSVVRWVGPAKSWCKHQPYYLMLIVKRFQEHTFTTPDSSTMPGLVVIDASGGDREFFGCASNRRSFFLR